MCIFCRFIMYFLYIKNEHSMYTRRIFFENNKKPDHYNQACVVYYLFVIKIKKYSMEKYVLIRLFAWFRELASGEQKTKQNIPFAYGKFTIL